MTGACLAALALQAGPLTVRLSSIDLTPPEPLPLGGLTERRGALFEPGGTHLMARTLLFERGTTRVALVSVETLTIPESLSREVQARVGSGITVLLAASHTHSAPDSQLLNERMTMAIPGIATYRRGWLEWTANRIAEGVKQAERTSPIAICELAVRRRRVDLNRARRAGAIPDPDLVWVSAPAWRGFGVYAAHPTVLPASWRKLDGDWIGRAMVAARAPIFGGAIGDVGPISEGTPEERLGRYVAAFSEVSAGPSRYGYGYDASSSEARWGRGLSALPFGIAKETISLDAVHPHPGFSRGFGIPEPLAPGVVAKFAPLGGDVVVIRFGKLALIGVPGEPTAELGRRLAVLGRGLGFRDVLVLSHVGGWIGYILQPEDYDRGGYEAHLAFHGRYASERVFEAARRALTQVSDAKPGR